jgi:hypothetical protein
LLECASAEGEMDRLGVEPHLLISRQHDWRDCVAASTWDLKERALCEFL